MTKYISGIPERIILKYFNYKHNFTNNNQIMPLIYNTKSIFITFFNSRSNQYQYYRVQSIFSYFFLYIEKHKYISIYFSIYKNIIIPQDNISNYLLKYIFNIDIIDEQYYFYVCHKNMVIYMTSNNLHVLKKIRYNLKILLLDINKNIVDNVNDLIYNLYIIIIKYYKNDIIKIKRIDL